MSNETPKVPDSDIPEVPNPQDILSADTQEDIPVTSLQDSPEVSAVQDFTAADKDAVMPDPMDSVLPPRKTPESNAGLSEHARFHAEPAFDEPLAEDGPLVESHIDDEAVGTPEPPATSEAKDIEQGAANAATEDALAEPPTRHEPPVEQGSSGTGEASTVPPGHGEEMPAAGPVTETGEAIAAPKEDLASAAPMPTSAREQSQEPASTEVRANSKDNMAQPAPMGVESEKVSPVADGESQESLAAPAPPPPPPAPTPPSGGYATAGQYPSPGAPPPSQPVVPAAMPQGVPVANAAQPARKEPILFCLLSLLIPGIGSFFVDEPNHGGIALGLYLLGLFTAILIVGIFIIPVAVGLGMYWGWVDTQAWNRKHGYPD